MHRLPNEELLKAIMRKRFHVLYFFILFIQFIPVFLAFANAPAMPQDVSSGVLEPVSINRIDELTREFTFDVSDLNMDQTDIAFFSKHQFIEVYSDGRLIYAYTEDGGIWGHTTGAFWNFVNIPYAATEVKMIFTAAYDIVANEVPTFLIGDELGIYYNIVRSSVPTLTVSFLTVVCGIMYCISWLFLHKAFAIGNSMLYLGCFSFLIGSYFLNETNAVILIMPNRIASVFLTYILLMAMSPTCILFIREFIGTVEDVLWKILCFAAAIELVICFTLQCLHIKDLRETLFVTHILIFVSAIYLLATIIIKLVRCLASNAKRKEKAPSENQKASFSEFYVSLPMLRTCLIGVLVLAISVLIDLASYYDNIYHFDTGAATRWGFYLFLWIIATKCMQYSFDLMQTGFHANALKKLAVVDMLTGLQNRNAYISDIETLSDCHDIMIVTFDLNNLKQCNDTLGHADGDFYIISSANIIKEVFSSYGSCYRIGGDEFCVIIKNASLCPIDNLIACMTVKEQDFMQQYPRFDMHISCGYAVYNQSEDSHIEHTRARADALMYENKRKSKETGIA